MDMNFDYFQMQKQMLYTDTAEKVDETSDHLSNFSVSLLSFATEINKNCAFLAMFWRSQQNCSTSNIF